MLRLQQNWSESFIENTITDLFNQLPSPKLRKDFATYIIGGVLHLHRDRLANCLDLLLEVTDYEARWRLGRLIYTYFPDIDDTMLDIARSYNAKLAEYTVTIIVPPNYSMVFSDACRHMLLTDEEDDIIGFPLSSLNRNRIAWRRGLRWEFC